MRGLRRERSPREKLSLIARSWRLLQGLTQEERERVALAFGSEWLWKRLERLFLADGKLLAWEVGVKRVLERAGGADPADLRAAAASLRARDLRGLPDILLDTLREALEGEAALRERGAGGAVARAQVEIVPEPGEDAAWPGGDEPEARPVEAQAPRPVEPAGPRPVEARAARPPEPPRPEPLPPLEDGAAPGARAPESAPPSEAPPCTPAVAVPPRRDGHVAAARELEPEPAALPAAVSSASPGLAAGERLARLRALRADPACAARLGPEERLALLDALGPGWASRRALSILLCSRAVSGLDEALALVARLPSAAQRVWCLADLLACWDLDDAGRKRVLDAAPGSAARRRLAGRCAGARPGARRLPERAP
jgi:hypothetical protein